MAHQIVIVPEGYAVIEQTYGYWSFGPARRLHFMCWTWPGCGEELSTTDSAIDPAQPNNADQALAQSHVWYKRLAKHLAEGATLLNQGAPSSWHLLDEE